jgi:UDP-2,4-diacetamido-2,4,6-trideoxy-beta-L-altropyranose hydrolase
LALGMESQTGSIKGATWAAIDNYAFMARQLERLSGDLRTLVYDDLGLFDPAASIVVNQNAGADVTFAEAYPASKMKLLGTRYAAIRRGVADARRVDEGHVLVCLGGSSDPALAAEVASEVASAIPSRDVILVAGADPVSSTDGAGNRLFAHLPPQELAPLISRAHIAVIGGGVTALEAAYLGVPAVVLVLAENQRPGALALAQAGACVTCESAYAAGRAVAVLAGEPARLQQMAEAGVAMVDGLGARRVADALAEFSGEAVL